MQRKRRVVLAVVGVLGIAVLIYTLQWPLPQAQSPAASPQARPERRVPVSTWTVQVGVMRQQLLATGDILADARVEVFPQIEGYLRELRVEEGDRIQAGQVLARIADEDLQAEVARAAAQLDALGAEWAEMQAGERQELAESNHHMILTTILALIPMAIGVGEGVEVWAPLGRVVLGGLTVTTFFTLFFIPSLYSLIEEHRDRRLHQPVLTTETLDTEVVVAD
jgi:hypothetical protein